MRNRLGLILVITVFCAMALLTVHAHEGRPVGPYTFTFGWLNEPAYTGQINAAELSIRLTSDNSTVSGADRTLTLDVKFGDMSARLFFHEDDETPGRYIASLIPSLPGDYTFQVAGKVGDTAVDEMFTSADGDFDSVDPVADIIFPPPSNSANFQALEQRLAELEAKVKQLEDAGK